MTFDRLPSQKSFDFGTPQLRKILPAINHSGIFAPVEVVIDGAPVIAANSRKALIGFKKEIVPWKQPHP